MMLTGVEPSLLEAPVNVLRLTLHPGGLSPRIANLPEWRSHLLSRLRRQIEISADPVLVELLDELSGYPVSENKKSTTPETDFAGVAVPFQLATEGGILSFLSTTTVFGTPVDITLSELALESFFPADAVTLDAVNQMMKRNEER
jgi:MmyB-like transcription regulator ligand binding domain